MQLKFIFGVSDLSFRLLNLLNVKLLGVFNWAILCHVSLLTKFYWQVCIMINNICFNATAVNGLIKAYKLHLLPNSVLLLH